MDTSFMRAAGAPVIRIGHRGAKGHAPENTLASFSRALEMRADIVELDVHLSQDGELIVMHDHSLERTTNGHGLVNDLKAAELLEFDAGSKFDARFAGEHIPTLDAVLAWARPSGIGVAIEIKNGPIYYRGIAGKVVQLLREYDMAGKAIVISFDHFVVREVKMIAPEIGTGILYAAGLIDPVAAAQAAGAAAIHANYAWVTPDMVASMHAAGMALSAWTPNDVRIIQSLDGMGVDSIATDYLELFDQL